MTEVAVAQRRLNATTLMVAIFLITAGFVIGFVLAEIVPVGDLSATGVHGPAPAANRASGQFGGLSPDDRQTLRGATQVSSSQSARFGGLSPDDRQTLRGATQVGSSQSARFGGLSPDDRQTLRGATQVGSGQSARFGGLSPDDRADLASTP